MRFDDSTGCLSSPSHGLVGRFLCRRMQEKALLFPENNFSRLRGNLGIVSWQVDFVSRKTLSLSLSLPIFARLRHTAYHSIEFIIRYVYVYIPWKNWLRTELSGSLSSFVFMNESFSFCLATKIPPRFPQRSWPKFTRNRTSTNRGIDWKALSQYWMGWVYFRMQVRHQNLCGDVSLKE